MVRELRARITLGAQRRALGTTCVLLVWVYVPGVDKIPAIHDRVRLVHALVHRAAPRHERERMRDPTIDPQP